jgi:hypothetical protein
MANTDVEPSILPPEHTIKDIVMVEDSSDDEDDDNSSTSSSNDNATAQVDNGRSAASQKHYNLHK